MAGKIIFPKSLRQVFMPSQGYSAGEWSAFIAPPSPLSLSGIMPAADDLIALMPKHPYKLRFTRLAVDIGQQIFSDVGGNKGGNAGASSIADEALTWKLVLARLDKKDDAENAVVAELSVAKGAGSAGRDAPAADTLEDFDMAASIKNLSDTAGMIQQDRPLIYTVFDVPVVLALQFSGASAGALEENAGDDTKAKRMQSKFAFYAEVRSEWSSQANSETA